MKILAILQNQWFREPEKVQAMYERHPEKRNDFIKTFLFMGCKTGQRLQSALGSELCESIIWEEAHSKIGGHASSNFGADLEHIKAAIEKHKPDIVIGFGKVATDALRQLKFENTIFAPHPAARINPMPELKAVRQKLENLPKAKGDYLFQ